MPRRPAPTAPDAPPATRSAAQPTASPAALPKGAKGFKQHLPTKPCASCGRPMAWRKAWARCWDEVKHCSDACRRGRHSSAGGAR